jgi:hypothetical protein
VQQHAARQGFVPGVMPGRMVLPASTAGLPPVPGPGLRHPGGTGGRSGQAAIREVTLSLDVPQVNRAEQPFVRMREAAIALAAAWTA